MTAKRVTMHGTDTILPLSEQKDIGSGGLSTPACFVLNLCNTTVLLECPLDLSALAWFLPSVRPHSDADQSGADALRRHDKTSSFPSKPPESSLAFKDNEQRANLHITRKRPHLNAQASMELGKCPHLMRNDFKEIDGRYFLDAEPWYKTPDFNLVDIGSLNAVIVSSPVAMLGLPILFRNPQFSAKVYATDATAKLGQLMMEELCELHREFIQIHGRSKKSAVPPWLLPDVSAAWAPEIKDQMNSLHCTGERWHPLYSTVDIRTAIERVHRLHYGEEANIDDFLRIKPSSSGFGIGSANWVLKGAHRSLSYISTLLLKGNPAMPLDVSALGGNQVLLFSPGHAMGNLQDEKPEPRKREAVVPESTPTDIKVVVDVALQEAQSAGEGLAGPKPNFQRTSPGQVSSVSSSLPIASVTSNAGVLHKLSTYASTQATPDVLGKSNTEDMDGVGASSLEVKDERIQLICKAAEAAISRGGSVLLPVSFYGIFLELAEDLSTHLRSVGLEHIPIYYISPVAEALLAYVNTVPEWLCAERQEKLYAGEALFGCVEALREKRMHHAPTTHSTDLMRCWQEPCVVFAAHWSLRVGSAMHLMNRWRNNPLSLLVLTELNIDQQLLLSPFVPFSIQVLSLPLCTGFRTKEIVSIFKQLKPQLTLIPKTLNKLEIHQGSAEQSPGLLRSYKIWKTLEIPFFSKQSDLDVELTADLSLQIQQKQVTTGKVTAAHLKGELYVKDGEWFLDVPSPSLHTRGTPVNGLPRYQIRWGNVNVNTLVTALADQGMEDFSVSCSSDRDDGSGETGNSKEIVVEFKSLEAKIELSSSKIQVHANESSVRHKLVEVVNRVLNVL